MVSATPAAAGEPKKSMSANFDTILLLALPASGKSEVRRYLASLPAEVQRRDFHVGSSVQLDDYPYVHMMRRLSQEMRAMGMEPAFFYSDVHSMKEPRDWGTLIELVNLDYFDLAAGRRIEPMHAGSWLLDRFEQARANLGIPSPWSSLSPDERAALADRIDREAVQLVADKNAGVPDSMEGKTLVIEFARGGPDASPLPLPAPFGYQHSLRCLAPEILSRAGILYVWVTPEESRRKNHERTDPNDPGSILHHGVPLTVMIYDYGCDDMAHLIEHSDKPDTVRVEKEGHTYNLPVARFDNRTDKTTFVRADRDKWKESDVAALHNGLQEAFVTLSRAYQAR